VPINTRTWLRRLTAQCPGWYVWYSEQASPRVAWHALPAPRDRVPGLTKPYGEVDASTPQLLRQFCHERYGWYDTCEACGALARDCNHSQVRRRSEAHR
jgi:hypothetical protein